MQQTEHAHLKPSRKNTSRPSNSKTNQGVHNYQLTEDGQYVLNSRGYPLCDYCGIPSHPRSRCNTRIKDETNGIKRTVHPNRGQILSGNQKRKEAAKLKNQTRKRLHQKQEDPHVPKTRPPHTHENNYLIPITMNDNQIPTTSTRHAEHLPTNLMDLPTETIRNIMRYLPFQEIMKLRRVNKRLWLLSGVKSLWKDITISNAPLSCGLISIALSKQVETLNIRNCTIQGSYLKMLNLGHTLQQGLSKLKFLGLQGYKGSDILAAIIIAESTELETLDMSESRYSMVGTAIGKMKSDNKLTAINLSAVGGHYAEMGGLVYHPFNIHIMKPLVDKFRYLTDVILFRSKLTHEAITYFCENAPPTLLRLNIARERAYNDDIRALTSSCPHLQYLNIAETSVAYQDIINIVLAWKRTLINLCLPHRLGFVLTL